MDSSIMPDTGKGSDTLTENVELPATVDSVSIDGTAPAVGDQIEVKVTGSVKRVVNDIVYFKPETVNDTPLPAPAVEPNPDLDEATRLDRMSQTAGNLPGY